MTLDHNTIERKAIDVSGRLGSFYDASSDLFIEHRFVKNFGKSANEDIACRIFSGDQSSALINYLREMNFNDALRQSILLGMITSKGITSLIDYNQPINEYTCFFYYLYKSREENLDIAAGEIDRLTSPPLYSTIATHMITKILWGFEVLCVIQVPTNQSPKAVEDLLYTISSKIPSYGKPLKLTDDERSKIAQLTNVTVFGSKNCVNNSNASLLTVLTKLRDWQDDNSFHHPLVYKMHPLRLRYNAEQFSDPHDISDRANCDIEQIQPILTRLNNQLKDVEAMFQNLPVNLSSPSVDKKLKEAQEHFHLLLDMRKHRGERLRKALVDMRRHQIASTTIDDIMFDKDYACLQETEMTRFQTDIQRLLERVMLIDRLNHDGIQYVNVSDFYLDENLPKTMKEIDEALRYSMSKEDTLVIIWYSTDRLKHGKSSRWEQIYKELTSKQQQATQRTNLIYADFSLCQYILDDFQIRRLPASSSESSRNHSIVRPLSPVPSTSPERPPTLTQRLPVQLECPPVPPERPSLPPEQLPVIDINVLMLGETGVGKSTFINAFVNYLMFDTLQQAEQDEPVVLIPVSFLITTGDQFEEFTVKFGDVDSNENHEHQGQSVTQQCKSYIFNLNDRLRLRFIDTPGMGDTRGIAQDEKNINHILTYIDTLPHLNAVCLLLKPNASRLNVFFRSCVNQLLTYLTPIGYNNIIFCFTNARSTFFAPGNTGPLLRQMLKQEHLDDIPFKKTNTFCFDSESFRYLAARKCGVTFDEFQNTECIKSWTTSVTEFVRLLNFILKRDPYCLDEWQSPRKVALEISMLARPLMETLRLILYNWKLREVGLIDNDITFSSNPVTTEICSYCVQSSIVRVGSFFIVEHGSVKNSTVQQCLCPFNERHFIIEATMKHDFVGQSINLSSDDLRNYFNDLLFKCDRLTHFLRQKGLLGQNDSFTPVLERFLDEEQYISEATNTNSNINKGVKEILHSVRELREQNSKRLSELHEELSLNQVYKIINELKSIRTVSQQIECIKRSRHLQMEANEYQVKIPSIKNRNFAELTNSSQ